MEALPDEARPVLEGRDIRSPVAVHHLPSILFGEAAVQEEPVTGGLIFATAYTSSEGLPPSHLPLQLKPTEPQRLNRHFTGTIKQKTEVRDCQLGGPGR